MVRFSIRIKDLSLPQRVQSSSKALSPPIPQASGTLSSEAKQLGREAGHCSAVPRFTNEWSHVSAAPPTGTTLHCVVGIVVCSLMV